MCSKAFELYMNLVAVTTYKPVAVVGPRKLFARVKYVTTCFFPAAMVLVKEW